MTCEELAIKIQPILALMDFLHVFAGIVLIAFAVLVAVVVIGIWRLA